MIKKGFTLIELMVVILIVAILAAVLSPMITGRIQAAKWTEGKAGAGTIVTAIRAYLAETEGNDTNIGTLSGAAAGGFTNIGITDADLAGKYFQASSYVATATVASGVLTGITVTVTAPTGFNPAKQLLTITLPTTGLATSAWSVPAP